MTTAPRTAQALPLVLQRDGACLREGVARRQGCRRNWAPTSPQTMTTNRPHHHAHHWNKNCVRPITNSETPHIHLATMWTYAGHPGGHR